MVDLGKTEEIENPLHEKKKPSEKPPISSEERLTDAFN